MHTSSINPPIPEQVLSDRDRQAVATTLYIKSAGAKGGLLALAAALRRRPLALFRCALRLLSIDLLDLPHALKRTMQFGEALILWHRCTQLGITSVHAHFGQAPATIAWYTAEIGRALDGGDWTWSVTIHGWTEFVIEDRAQLAQKMAHADLVVCISDFTKAQLQRIGGRSNWDKIKVVRCGIDLDRFALRPPRAVAEIPTIVVTARLSEEKGHFVLLEAAARLRRHGQRLRLRFIGPGHLAEAITGAAQQLGLSDDVELLGPLPPERVHQELLAADVFCLPTSAEGLPVAIMEAMAVGLPVVTTYISGIPELVIDGVSGRVVPAARPDLIADALRQAIGDSKENADMITTARDLVATHHNGHQTNAELLCLLTDTHHLPVPGSASRH